MGKLSAILRRAAFKLHDDPQKSESSPSIMKKLSKALKLGALKFHQKDSQEPDPSMSNAEETSTLIKGYVSHLGNDIQRSGPPSSSFGIGRDTATPLEVRRASEPLPSAVEKLSAVLKRGACKLHKNPHKSGFTPKSIVNGKVPKSLPKARRGIVNKVLTKVFPCIFSRRQKSIAKKPVSSSSVDPAAYICEVSQPIAAEHTLSSEASPEVETRQFPGVETHQSPQVEIVKSSEVELPIEDEYEVDSTSQPEGEIENVTRESKNATDADVNSRYDTTVEGGEMRGSTAEIKTDAASNASSEDSRSEGSDAEEVPEEHNEESGLNAASFHLGVAEDTGAKSVKEGFKTEADSDTNSARNVSYDENEVGDIVGEGNDESDPGAPSTCGTVLDDSETQTTTSEPGDEDCPFRPILKPRSNRNKISGESFTISIPSNSISPKSLSPTSTKSTNESVFGEAAKRPTYSSPGEEIKAIELEIQGCKMQEEFGKVNNDPQRFYMRVESLESRRKRVVQGIQAYQRRMELEERLEQLKPKPEKELPKWEKRARARKEKKAAKKAAKKGVK